MQDEVEPASGGPQYDQCPRCGREMALQTLEQAGQLSSDTMCGHIVILAMGDARVCFGGPDAGPSGAGEPRRER